MNPDFYIIIDASFSPSRRLGVMGAVIASAADISAKNPLPIKTKTIECTSCSRAEVLTSLWAMALFQERYPALVAKVKVGLVSDCQGLLKLPQRRTALASRSFRSKRTGELLKNADIYQQFFQFYDEMQLQLFWRKGHDRKENRDSLGLILSEVDRRTRDELREARA